MAEASIHPDAEAEYEAALGWYLQRSIRASDRFESAFDRAVQAIAESPKDILASTPCTATVYLDDILTA